MRCAHCSSRSSGALRLAYRGRTQHEAGEAVGSVAASARAREGRNQVMARLVVIGLVALHVVLAAVLLADDSLHTGTFAERSDAARFHKIAIAPGEPYRDFEVEYPPALVVTSKVLDDGSFPAFVDRLILVNLVADLGCALMLGLWWRKAVVSYLVLSAPLLPLVLAKLDVCAVGIAL